MSASEKVAEKFAGVLLQGETLLAFVAGSIQEGNSSATNSRGLLVVTDQRFLFRGTKLGLSKQSRAVPLAQVTSIELHKNLIAAHLLVGLASGTERYLVKFKEAEPFVSIARGALTTAHTAVTTPAPTSTADELAKLAALRDGGALSDAEFATAKARLLA